MKVGWLMRCGMEPMHGDGGSGTKLTWTYVSEGFSSCFSNVISDFLMNKINFVRGDKLSPVFKHGFLKSEENVFPAIFLHTKCMWENVCLYNFEYLCMVGSITIHVGRCYCLVLPNTLCFVADVIDLADVIAMFCVLFPLLRLMFLPHY